MLCSSLEEHKKGDDCCQDIVKKIREKQPDVDGFQAHVGLLSYFSKR